MIRLNLRIQKMPASVMLTSLVFRSNSFTPSSDPLLDAVTPYVADYTLSDAPKDMSGLDKLLSNEKIFGVDLHTVGMADLVKEYFTELSSGVGAVKATLEKYVK